MLSKKLLHATFVVVLCGLLGGCYSHAKEQLSVQASPPVYPLDQSIENIVYTASYWPQPLQADLHLPRKPGLHPVVLMVHGGGWASRGRDDMDDVSRKLVSHGYAVFNVSYRFAPRFKYPAQLQDLQQALVWIAENARRYNLDIDRINAWGYSSGAHLAALVGSMNANHSRAVNLPELPRINAVVAGGIPSDLRKFSDSPIVMRFLGGELEEMPERYAEASPVYHVSSDDPPVFLYHGKLDFLVTDDHASDYHQTLIAAGVESELYLHNWRGHMSMFLFGDDAENRAIDFLDRYGASTRPG